MDSRTNRVVFESDYREWWCIEILSNGKLMGKAIFCTFIDVRWPGISLESRLLASRFIKVKSNDQNKKRKLHRIMYSESKHSRREKPLQRVSGKFEFESTNDDRTCQLFIENKYLYMFPSIIFLLTRLVVHHSLSSANENENEAQLPRNSTKILQSAVNYRNK